MPSALDSTHTVVVKSENRGLRVVIGLLALILFVKWWWTGSVLFAFESVMPAEDGSEPELRSVTGALLPIFIDMLWFIGSVVVFATTKLAAVLWDVGIGLFETVRYYSARRSAVDAAKTAATEAGSDAAQTNAGSIASAAAVDSASKQAAAAGSSTVASLDPAKVAHVLNDHENRLVAVDRRYEQFAERVSMLADSCASSSAKCETEANARHADDLGLAESIGKLAERVTAIETAQSATAAATPSKPTRRTVRRSSSKPKAQ